MLGKGKKLPLMWDAFKFYAQWYPKQWLPAPRAFGVERLSAANRAHLAFVAKTSKRLARTMLHTMAKYKQKLEYEQIILRQFVDIGTYLFTMASTLAYAEALLKERPGDEHLQDMVDLYCTRARKHIADAFRTVKKSNSRLINKVSRAFLEGHYEWLTEGAYTETPPPGRVAQRTGESIEEAAETPESEAVHK
jgi:hypothetical protein